MRRPPASPPRQLPRSPSLLGASSKVRDLSHTAVTIAPADYSSWHDVRQELMAEAKTGFKARIEAELAAANGESLDELRAAFQQEERAIEHTIDHEVHTFSAMVDVSYNVRRLPPVEPPPSPARSRAAPLACGSSYRTRCARALSRRRTLVARSVGVWWRV